MEHPEMGVFPFKMTRRPADLTSTGGARPMRRLVPLLLALAFLATLPAGAEIYHWTDARGRTHFSQDLGRVPPEHRAAARAAASSPRSDRVQRYSSGGSSRAMSGGPSRRSASLGSARTLSIPFESRNNLMFVQVRLNDRVSAPFVVDTGASMITLPRALADRLGIRVGPQTRRERFTTANGDIWEPIIRLDSVEVGGARAEGIDASISSTMQVGLLGGSFFNNFVYRVDAASGRIELELNESVRGGLSAQQWQERFRQLRHAVESIDHYLANNQLARESRVREIQERRAGFEEQLRELERDANAAGVPQAWRR
jgi:clan AA aspartic protease (TIGR02281 family)